MKYQTYRGVKTKYRQKEITIIKASFIILLLSASLLSAVTHKEVKVVPVAKAEVKAITPVKESNKDILTRAAEQACKRKGLGSYCVKDLIGMAYTETRSYDFKAIGDGGKSVGAFQIHLGYHPEITMAQAQDPFWAADWTLSRLVAKGYPVYRSVAIMSHNGTPNTDKTKGYLNTVNSIALK